MAFEEISGARRYVRHSGEPKEPGTVLAEGWYMGIGKGPFGIFYLIREDSGGEVAVNSAGHLDHLMDRVSQGDFVQIVYKGKEILKKGPFAGRPSHTFTIFRDREKSGKVPGFDEAKEPESYGDISDLL